MVYKQNSIWQNLSSAEKLEKGNSLWLCKGERQKNIILRKVKEKMRKFYSEPSLDVTVFASADVIMASSIIIDMGDGSVIEGGVV